MNVFLATPGPAEGHGVKEQIEGEPQGDKERQRDQLA